MQKPNLTMSWPFSTTKPQSKLKFEWRLISFRNNGEISEEVKESMKEKKEAKQEPTSTMNALAGRKRKRSSDDSSIDSSSEEEVDQINKRQRSK